MSLYSKAKSEFRKTLNSVGFDIKRFQASESFALDSNLSSIQYQTNLSDNCYRVEIGSGRSSKLFSLGLRSEDPRIVAVREAKNVACSTTQLQSVIEVILNLYRETCPRPKTFFEVWDLPSPDDSAYSSWPYWSAVQPWDYATPEKRYSTFPKEVKINRAAHGLKIESALPEKIMELNELGSDKSHSSQLAKITKSFLENGFIRTRNLPRPTADLLEADGDFRWKISGEGNHRLVVASALGFTHFDVNFERIICREDVDRWPNVIRGVFSKDTALKIFESHFSATPMSYDHGWQRLLRDQPDILTNLIRRSLKD